MNQLEPHLLWFVGGTVAVVPVAWIAFLIQQQGVAPVVLFQLATGGVLGAILVALWRKTQRPAAKIAILLAVAWGLLLVVAQDYIGHRQRLQMYETEVVEAHPLAAAMAGERDLRPSFGHYLSSKVQGQPLWWSLDLLLTAAAAGGVVAFGTRPAASKHPEPPASESTPDSSSPS